MIRRSPAVSGLHPSYGGTALQKARQPSGGASPLAQALAEVRLRNIAACTQI
jgi:hypothetical protein